MENDRLSEMLKMQRTLQESLGYKFHLMSEEDRTAFQKEMSIHLTQELHECLYEMPYFKQWKDYSKMTSNDLNKAAVKVQEELVDMWHFFMNMLIAADMSADDLYTMYKEKNQENYDRQVRGYTHDVSYREDSK